LNNLKRLKQDSQIKSGNFYSGKTLQPRLVNNKVGLAPTRRCIDLLFRDAHHLSPKFVSSPLLVAGPCDHTILILIVCQLQQFQGQWGIFFIICDQLK